ncbi:alpha-amylase family glycosyl hydrolase [Methanolobus sediminis]|uniref:Alpha-amylase family glycosyl hydrolase n=1 Tax=Methanolobus sediminis TaxID=3072978 RepID=A0AA51ULD0_9EURY|nr:alpha-amylase family glycosyl hydrolase [Methanolobus sediminis]WMW25474.1 alpha-amylase family glycosyl hydrolase [Methanolobus sediminis]
MGENIQSVKDINFDIQNSVFPSPSDWRDVFIYFLLVDRFDNNAVDTEAYSSSSESQELDISQGKKFQGGNIKGITRRLDYIKGLGANAIWLSPVFRNRQEKEDSYHGYGIQDFLRVDERFGSLEDLQELVKEAHSRDMYVILDIIINHTGDNWSYPGSYPYYYWKDAPGPFDFGKWRTFPTDNDQNIIGENDAVWPEELQDPECYKRRGQITDWNDNEQAVNGDFFTLKELDVRRYDVLDTLIKAYKYWIKTTDIDGFRMDTVKHLESSSTAIFCNAIKEYAKSIGKHNFFIFGEIVGDDTTIQQYIGRNSRIPGTNERFPSLDAALDFPLYFVLEEVIKGFNEPSVLRNRYDAFRNLYTDHGEAGRYFVTFVDNHDQMIRPYRRFMYGNTIHQQVVLAMTYLLTSQGIPCIYYGTEQGFDGGGEDDVYIRECMFGGEWGAFGTKGYHFFNPDNPIYKDISRVAGIRLSEPALRYGRQYFRQTSETGKEFSHPSTGNCILAYSRILDTTEILVALNLDSESRSDCIVVDSNLHSAGQKMKDLLHSDNEYLIEQSDSTMFVKVSLEPYSMAILKQG